MIKSDNDLRGDGGSENPMPDQAVSASQLVLSGRIGQNQHPGGSHERLEKITDNIPGIVFQLQLPLFGQPRFNFVNRGIEIIWNISPEEAQADFNLFWQRISTEDRGPFWESLQFSAKHQRAWKHEFRSRFQNGRIRWMRVQAAPEIDSETGGTTWNGILLDITDQKNAEQRLRQAAIAFENTAEGVMITDQAGRIVDVNRAFTVITGFSQQEALGHSPRLLKSDKHDSDFYRSMWEALQNRGEWKGEIWNRRKNGETYPQWLRINAVRDSKGRVSNFVAVFADISSVKESEAKLMHMAHHDALTGLPNRLLFKARLEHALNRSHRSSNKVALLFLDLDRFKIINDSLGHAVGDQVLKLVASRLLSCVREDDTVARVGGDEFIIVLENLSSATSASHVADKILSQLSRPFKLGNDDMFVTTSIGISLYPDDGTDIQTLQKNADMAMYRAKEEGRNGYFYYTPELTARIQERMDLETKLRSGLDNGEIQLYYQPQVSAADGSIVGIEALIRWRRPDQGLLSPSSFIELAEEVGLLEDLGDWAMDKACKQIKRWQETLLPGLRLAINVSDRQLGPSFPRRLHSILEAAGLAPENLELEIAEGFLVDRADSKVATLNNLRSLGVSLAIDDFGTGHSSLSHLKRLPIQRLKIDQALVREIPDDPDSRAIVQTVIALGHNLGFSLIAEGVETEAQRDFLCRKGCNEFQGFLFGKPMPARELEAYFCDRLPGSLHLLKSSRACGNRDAG